MTAATDLTTDFLTRKQAADEIGVSVAMLDIYRKMVNGPRAVIVGGRPLFTRDELARFKAERTVREAKPMQFDDLATIIRPELADRLKDVRLDPPYDKRLQDNISEAAEVATLTSMLEKRISSGKFTQQRARQFFILRTRLVELLNELGGFATHDETLAAEIARSAWLTMQKRLRHMIPSDFR